MVAAALPAPTTIVRPVGGWGRNGGRHLSGIARATAASNMRRRREIGSVVIACESSTNTETPRRIYHEGHEGSRGKPIGKRSLRVGSALGNRMNFVPVVLRVPSWWMR